MNPSHDYDRILTRLTTILQRLYAGETLRVSELAAEFNVSTKTIQRDFNERLVRFPIEKAGRGWRMQEGHRLEKIQEIDNLLTLQILESLAVGVGGRFAERSRHLLGRLKNDSPLPLESHLNIEDVTALMPLLETIRESIGRSKRLRFDYHGKSRRVDPYRIVNFDGYWYLLGREEASGLVKKYYLRDIRDARTGTESFEPDETLKERIDGALNVWFDPNLDPFELHLFVEAPMVKYLRRRPLGPTQRIEAEHENGGVEVRLKATTLQEALTLLKPWMPHVRVLGPDFVAEAYADMLKKALERQTGHDAV